VGGPLPLMRPSETIHLRILVDHSCVEVYTGTGEVGGGLGGWARCWVGGGNCGVGACGDGCLWSGPTCCRRCLSLDCA
jgi:hypothetical protein